MNENNLYSTPQAALNTNQEVYYEPKILSWSGRIGRLRYFVYLMSMYFLVGIVVGLASSLMFSSQAVQPLFFGLVFIIYIAAFVFLISIAKRRLNDFNASGWLCLLYIVPVVNFILLLVLLFMPGDKTSNNYGPMPSKSNSTTLAAAAIASVMVIVILAAIAIPAYKDYVKRAQMQANNPSLQRSQ